MSATAVVVILVLTLCAGLFWVRVIRPKIFPPGQFHVNGKVSFYQRLIPSSFKWWHWVIALVIIWIAGTYVINVIGAGKDLANARAYKAEVIPVIVKVGENKELHAYPTEERLQADTTKKLRQHYVTRISGADASSPYFPSHLEIRAKKKFSYRTLLKGMNTWDGPYDQPAGEVLCVNTDGALIEIQDPEGDGFNFRCRNVLGKKK